MAGKTTDEIFASMRTLTEALVDNAIAPVVMIGVDAGGRYRLVSTVHHDPTETADILRTCYRELRHGHFAHFHTGEASDAG